MQVECPHCETVFNLTNEQLKVADGMVRCGLCHQVFNALEDDPFYTAENEQAPTNIEPSTEEKSVSDISKSEQEDDYFDFDNQATTNKASQKSSSEDDLFDGVQSKLIPDEYRIPELHIPYSIWKDITWSLAILLLAVSLFIEYAWFNRNELVKNPQLKPWVTKICNFADCQAMDLRYPKEIEMVSRQYIFTPKP